MSVGQMKHRLSIRTPIRESNGRGGFRVTGYSEPIRAWGQIKSLRMEQQIRYLSAQIEATYEIKVRSETGITEGHRIFLENGQEMEITAIQPGEFFTTLAAKERAL